MPTDPSSLNGDTPLSPDEVAAYMAHHAARNAERRAASRAITTRPGPAPGISLGNMGSPSRISVSRFFRHAARDRFGDRPITILDLGCGRGNSLDPFLDLGMRGEDIGIDLARHPRWTDEALGGFTRRLITADANRLAEADLPMAHIVCSSTALEHIRDDAAAVEFLKRRTLPGGFHAHAVPAEWALPLYGTQGWRQYSPVDLEAFFPGADIYRYGGPASNWWHTLAITRPSRARTPLLCKTRPRLYAAGRRITMLLDRALREPRPTIYGVLWQAPRPAHTEASAPIPRAA